MAHDKFLDLEGLADVKTKIDNDLSTKLNKLTSGNKVYVHNDSTQTDLEYTTSDTASTIVQRDANKQINIADTPTANTHAASKYYVDTGLSNKYDTSNPNGYQANVLEGVQVNGTDLSISSKKVNLLTKTAYNSSTNKIATESDLPTKSSLGLDNVVNVGMDNSPTQYSDNGVKSGGVYSAIQNVAELAEGKTKNYVISDASATGYVNDSFNSTNNTITLTITGNKIKDVENNDISLSDLKIGDIVSIIETDVPDRWVGSISGGSIVLYKLETKLDIATQVQNGNANPVSSGAVYTELTTNYLRKYPMVNTTTTMATIASTYGAGSYILGDYYVVSDGVETFSFFSLTTYKRYYGFEIDTSINLYTFFQNYEKSDLIYSAAKTYNANQVCLYNGYLVVSLADSNTGHTPSTSADTSYWARVFVNQ